MVSIKNEVKNSFNYIKAFFKWLVVACIIGVIGGIIGSIFHMCLDYVTSLRSDHYWLIYFLPIGGIIIAMLYRIFNSKGKIDTNRVIEAVRKDKKIPLVMIPLIFISTLITHMFGGSAGREGAALQLGGSLGYNFGKVLKFNEKDTHIVILAGMSSVFAALFGTPLTAAIFSLEVISVGILYYSAFFPCVMASVIACQIAQMFGLSPVKFDMVIFEAISIEMVIKVMILAGLCAVVSIIFCTALKKSEHYMKKLIRKDYLRAFCGGIIIVVLTFAVGTFDYNGAGMDVISRAISGEAKYEAFILKIIFTAITIAAGFKGGEIVPSFFIGATFGCIAGTFLGLEPGFAAAIGLVSVFCGVVNCPIASVFLSAEVFGAQGMLFFAIACAVSYMMSGYFGLYKSQKFIYSKINAEYININAK